MLIRSALKGYREPTLLRAMEFDERFRRGARRGTEREHRRVGLIERLRVFEVPHPDDGRQSRANISPHAERLNTRSFRRKLFTIEPKAHLQIRIRFERAHTKAFERGKNGESRGHEGDGRMVSGERARPRRRAV